MTDPNHWSCTTESEIPDGDYKCHTHRQHERWRDGKMIGYESFTMSPERRKFLTKTGRLPRSNFDVV